MDNEDKSNSKDIVVSKKEDVKISTQGLSLSKLDTLSTSEKLEVFTQIASSKISGIESAADAMVVYYKCHDLGISWSMGLDHMFNIDGKTGVDIHIIYAMVLKDNDIKFRILKNADYVYQYVTKNGIYTDEDKPDNLVVVSPNPTEAETKPIKDAGNIPAIKQKEILFTYKIGNIDVPFYNREAVIEFTRIRENDTLTSVGKFSNKDAYIAGLLTKDNGELKLKSAWFKYNENQLYVRAFTMGARRIASDKLLGVYEKTELYDVKDISYTEV